MGRRVKDASLQSRESRRSVRKSVRPVWRSITEGLSLGYYKGLRTGSWQARLRVSGRYVFANLGLADDVLDADGATVLSFGQAQEAAQAFEKRVKTGSGAIRSPLTVQQAADEYMEWFKAHRKGVATTETFLRAHILPAFGAMEVSSLNSRQIQQWLTKLSKTPARLRTSRMASQQAHRKEPLTPDVLRARKSTANRVLTVLKAVLNKAFQGGHVESDAAWRRVRPFQSIDDGAIRYLTPEESVRLLDACEPALKNLVRAALYTGARYGELARLTTGDAKIKEARIHISPASKSGKARHVPLSPEGVRFFSDLIKGRSVNELLLLTEGGLPWRHNYHMRAFVRANHQAKIDPPARFHDLRHTYATMVANIPGNTLDVLAEILGHSDTRITRRHYAFLFDETKQKAVQDLPSMGYESS